MTLREIRNAHIQAISSMTSETLDNINMIYCDHYTPTGVQHPDDTKAPTFYFVLLDVRLSVFTARRRGHRERR